jgi:MmyB-like transcription regulator ligand binding domain
MLAEAGEDAAEIPGQKRSRRTKNNRIDAVQAARTAPPAQCVAYIFLHPTARTLFDGWEGQLRICVTHLRALSSLERDAPDLGAIVGELILKSSHFAGLWRRYDLHGHTRGHKTFHHPEVGDLTLGHQSMALNGRPGRP